MQSVRGGILFAVFCCILILCSLYGLGKIDHILFIIVVGTLCLIALLLWPHLRNDKGVKVTFKNISRPWKLVAIEDNTGQPINSNIRVSTGNPIPDILFNSTGYLKVKVTFLKPCSSKTLCIQDCSKKTKTKTKTLTYLHHFSSGS